MTPKTVIVFPHMNILQWCYVQNLKYLVVEVTMYLLWKNQIPKVKL